MAEQSRQDRKLDSNEAAKELKGSACDLDLPPENYTIG